MEPAHFTSEEEKDRLGSDSQGAYVCVLLVMCF